MTSEQADIVFGKVVFQNANNVVRVKETATDVEIYVHKKNHKGEEIRPLGYMVGANFLKPDYSGAVLR